MSRIAAASLRSKSIVPIDVDGEEFVVWRADDGRVCSAPRWCPHLDHDLAEGFVDGAELVCAGHGWAFDGAGHAFKRNEFGRIDPKGTVEALLVDEADGAIHLGAAMTLAYPPERHLLRDLRLSFSHDEVGVTSRAWLPVVPEVCNDAGFVRAGVLATLVDVIGGGLAGAAAHPNWIATADLTLHVVAGVAPGATVEARGRTLRAGRTTVVLEVDLFDEAERELGLATMSFSVLPRRDANPDLLETATPGPTTMAAAGSGLAHPIAEMLDVRVLDAAHGVIELPVTDWARNSMGALQGGVVALVADLAAEPALRAAGGRAAEVADLHLVYLGFGRVGLIRTRAAVLSPQTARVEIVDAGAEDRRMTIASVRTP